MSGQSAENDGPVEKVSDLPSFYDLHVHRHPSVPAPLVLCRVCGLAVVDIYVLVHRRSCVIPLAPTDRDAGR